MNHRPIRPRAGAMAMPGQAGSATAELALVTPLLLLLLLLVVAGGRVATGRQQVEAAARDAARAASIQRDPATAIQVAEATATATLAAEQLTCADLAVATDTTGFVPGGQVTVEVRCRVLLADLTLLGLPGSQTLQAGFTHPVDTFRGVLP